MTVENHFGRTSVLSLKTKYKAGKSILDDCYFTVPFKIAKPFYNADNEMKVIVMSASAGMMAGDCQEVSLDIGQDTMVRYTTQSYEKVHKMEEGQATRTVHIHIGKNAYLKYTPLATIPFADSALKSRIEINLEDHTSRLFMADVVTAGRIAHHEAFQYRYYSSRITVKENGKWIYRDYTCYDPRECELQDFNMFEGYTHIANIVLVNFMDNKKLLNKIREVIDQFPEINGGASLGEHYNISVKALGKNAQQLERLIERINELISEKGESLLTQ